VVQARDRRGGLAHLEARLTPGSIVLLEDGHQTAGVGRDLDVLILDRWTERASAAGRILTVTTGPVAPLGPWRESAAGAERAGIWLLEGEAPPAAADGRPVAGFVRRLRLEGAAAADDGPWAALSGIARPGRFERGVAAVRGTPPTLAVRCADHEPYRAGVRRRVWRELRAAGSPVTVTTEKDWIKLRDGWPADLPVAVAVLELRWTGARTLPDLVGERCDACRE
jgi:tetraacyldisaccharide-1-P 4'-kinase